MLRWLAALAAGLTLALPATAAPAMWRVADEDSQLWLFGSIHFLNEGAEWRTPAFDAALAESKLVYFELILNEAQAEVGAVFQDLARTPPGKTLSDYFDAEQLAKWTAAAEAMGIDQQQYTSFRPWVLAMSLPTQTSVNVNFAGGIEALLQAEIEDERERGFETLSSQLRHLSDMSDAGQVELLMNALDLPAVTQDVVDALIEDWITGDVAAVATLVDEQIGGISTEAYERLIVQRNIAWAEEALKILAGPDDAMIVVGAGHFVGDESLIALLERAGLTVERVQ